MSEDDHRSNIYPCDDQDDTDDRWDRRVRARTRRLDQRGDEGSRDEGSRA